MHGVEAVVEVLNKNAVVKHISCSARKYKACKEVHDVNCYLLYCDLEHQVPVIL